MPTIDIFVPSHDLIPLEELLELTAEDNVHPLTDADANVIGYRAEWDDALTFEARILVDDAADEALASLAYRVRTWLGGRDDKKAQKVARRAQAMQMVYRVTVEPDWDMARNAQQMTQGIMAYYDYALMATPDAIYNENGNREIGTEDSERKYWLQPDPEELASPEARERKVRSIATLKREKVAFIEHLPVIADSLQTTLRPVEDVLKRALALLLIAERADGMPLTTYEEHVKAYRLGRAITSAERTFADEDAPREDYVLAFSQRWESALLLLWALQIVKHLDRPENFVNPDFLRQTVYEHTYDALLARAQLRPVDELLDLLDLTYRYHWAVIDAELYGNAPPARLQPSILYERHYALNWLTGYRNQDWDDVKTDT